MLGRKNLERRAGDFPARHLPGPMNLDRPLQNHCAPLLPVREAIIKWHCFWPNRM